MSDDLPTPGETWPPNPQSTHPAWVPCECCGEWLCTIHDGKHAFDCECPAVEDWACDPYSAGGCEVDDGSAAAVAEILAETEDDPAP